MNASLCNDERLRVLLSDDEGNDSFRVAARHVEACETCQKRLTTLAGEVEWWSDAHLLLAENGEPRWEPDTSCTAIFSSHADDRDERLSIDDSVRGILGEPRHPELLGRLGRYDIERVIGSGGCGIVFKAHDTELNRPVAVKTLASHLAHVGAARQRFSREGRAAAAVVHEHVVAIYNVESDGAVPFLVMQYVPGRSLQARVDEDGPLAALEVLRIGVQAASGLAAAHRQGLVHRDVKPSNILLEDTVERAVLTDFGLARAMDDASLTQTGVVAGTPHYMSPEQATGQPIDHRSDLFSLGSVLYFMVAGRPPFRAQGTLAVLNRICHEPHRPLWQLNSSVPDELIDVIDRLLEKKPGRRFASAEEVGQRLAELLSRAQQHGLGRRRFRALRTRGVKRAMVAAFVCVMVIGAAVGLRPWWSGTAMPVEELVNSARSDDTEVKTDVIGSSINTAQKKPPADVTSLTAAASPPLDKESFEAGEQAYAGQFVDTLGAAQSAVERSSYFQTGDSWDRELNLLDRELKRLEADPDYRIR